MDKKSFIESLREKIPPDLRGRPLERYIEMVKRRSRNNYAPSDYNEAIEDINSLAVDLTSQKDALPSCRVETNSQALLTGKVLIDRITPAVQEIRNKLFGAPQPPFD